MFLLLSQLPEKGLGGYAAGLILYAGPDESSKLYAPENDREAP